MTSPASTSDGAADETTWHAPFGPELRAVVVGASGGIGAAIAGAVTHVDSLATVVATTRSGELPAGIGNHAKVTRASLDLADEASIAAFVSDLDFEPSFVFNATGLLHDADRDIAPERRLADISADNLHALYAANAAGPLLLAKHLVPRMPRKAHCVFASLSARVGSIDDNRLGGWYAYRMSKAAHNMGIRCLAIEAARRHRGLVCASLHPGTVATELSAPFSSNVPSDRLLSPQFAAERLLEVIGSLSPAHTGGFFAWDGQSIAF